MHESEMHGVTGTPLSEQDQALLLLEEIASLERRLNDMGMDGDCAYERAISRVYTGLVEKRKQQLAALQGGLTA